MSPVSRQDMQTMLNQQQLRLQERIATKQDVQRAADNARDRMISYMHDYLQQNQQQYARQLEEKTRSFKSQISSMEARMQSLEQEVRSTYHLLTQMAQKQRSIVIPGVQEAVSNNYSYRYAQEG